MTQLMRQQLKIHLEALTVQINI